jgi:alpha-tubulin suppressor-like RCC1 family protein
MLTAMLGGCILSKTPAADNVTMSYGETKTFSVTVFGNNDTLSWTLDGVPLALPPTAKSYDYTALAGKHTLVVRAAAASVPIVDFEAWYITANGPPTANAGPTQTVGEDITVTLDASNSSDPDNDIVSYLWEQTGGPDVTLSDASDVKPTFTSPLVPIGGAALTFKVTVTDATALTSTATTIVNVTWSNNPPAANAGPDQTVAEGVLVTLDASGSTDPDDGIASYAWEQIAGPLPFVTLTGADTVNPTFTSPHVGIGGEALVFKLTVTDNGGLKTTDTVIVNVTWSNLPPTAYAGPDQIVSEGSVVTLDGSASIDTDDGIASYAWVQTGGAAVTLSNPAAVKPTFTTPDVGMAGDILTFELTVTDNGGLQTTDSVTITVNWVNAPPVAAAGSDQNVLIGGSVTLDGSASTDPDDGIASYHWAQTGGPAVALVNPDTAIASFTASVAAGSALTFSLTVTDVGGLHSTDTCIVNVLADAVYSKISGGYYFSVGLKTDGTLWTWGLNAYGQLGDGSITTRLVPTQIGTDTDWASIAAGNYHTVALKTDGTLWAWGYNDKGQLGDGTTTTRLVPTQIGTASDWVMVDAGYKHTVALKANGTVWAWGLNDNGQLGVGSFVDKLVPTQASTLTGCTMINAGNKHSAAIKGNLGSGGTLWAWGDNFYGQVGDGTLVDKTAPVQIGALTTWVMVNAGDDYTLAKKADGTLFAWGRNTYGQLGDGTTVNKTAPVSIGGAATWASADAGTSHTVAIMTDGTLWCWGYNNHGQLGLGDTLNRLVPTQVGADTDWAIADAGYWHTLAKKTDGTLYTCGYNNNGQLGDGTTTESWVLTLIW